MHSYVYQVSLQPVQSESYAKAGHLPDWFYEQVCSYAENTDPAWREQAIQKLVQFLGPLCTAPAAADWPRRQTKYETEKAALRRQIRSF